MNTFLTVSCTVIKKQRREPVSSASFTEAALGQLEAMQTRLAQQERDLQAEIDVLREELRRDQDPSRMQLIQEMISVRIFALVLYCTG